MVVCICRLTYLCHVSLNPELEDGLNGEASGLVSEPLRPLFKRDAMESQLRDKLSIGIDQLDRGERDQGLLQGGISLTRQRLTRGRWIALCSFSLPSKSLPSRDK